MENKPIFTIDEFHDCIKTAQANGVQELEIGFATIERSSMHPQHGIPQLYQDQLNIIGEHLWELSHNPEWQQEIEEALPCLEVVKEDMYADLSDEDKAALHKALQAKSVKKQPKLTRKLLKQRNDWHDWQQ